MKVRYSRLAGSWGVYDVEGWCVGYTDSPREARRLARQWYAYLTAPTDQLAEKYLRWEIVLK